MTDTATIVPVPDRRYAYAAVLSPTEVDAILRSVIFVKGEPHGAQPPPVRVDCNGIQTTEEFMAHLRGQFDKHPDAQAFIVAGGTFPHRCFVSVLRVLMEEFAFSRRQAMVTVVDPEYDLPAGWSKGFIWRKRALEMGSGLSSLMVQGMAAEMARVARTGLDMPAVQEQEEPEEEREEY